MKKLVSVLLTLAVVLGLSLTMAAPVAAQDDPTLMLENKDSSNWTVIEDGIQGTLVYYSSGPEFKFKFNATGLDNNTGYSLIYYADFDTGADRFAVWGGNNPGALIANFTTDGSGDIPATWQSVELNMNLPCHPDANIDVYDYSGPPDNYTHAHGAKIWLVPSTDYSASACKVTTWAPDEFLFETDLIWYTDTGSSVSLTADVPDIVAISVNPTSIDFGTLLPGSTSDVFNINVTNIGTHTVNVSASLDASSDALFGNLGMRFDSSGSFGTEPWDNIITDLAMDGSKYVQTRLPVPSDYTPSGTETGLLIFEATAA